MVPTTSRRRLLAVGGLAAVAGCLSRSSGDSTDGTNGSGEGGPGGSDGDGLPDAVSTALEPIPASVEGSDVGRLTVYAPRQDPGNSTASVLTGAVNGLELDATTVDRIAAARYRRSLTGDADAADVPVGSIRVYVGDFDAGDVVEPDDAVTVVEDGFAITARTESGVWDAGLDAAATARESTDVRLVGDGAYRRLFEALADSSVQIAVPRLTESDLPEDADVDLDGVATVGVGLRPDREASEQTFTYAAVFEEGAAADASVLEDLLRSESPDVETENLETETDGRLAAVTFTRPMPDGQASDDSPDVWVGVRYDPETATTSLEVRGEESVEATDVEFLVDGESADPPWDADATLSAGDSFEIDVPFLSVVVVEWHDPEREDATSQLGWDVVGARHAFEDSFDHETQTLTITYRGDVAVDPGRFDFQRSEGTDETRDQPLDEVVDDLDPGTEIVVEDLSYGERVEISVTREGDSWSSTNSVYSYFVRPPGHFRLTTEAGQRVLAYEGESSRPASDYRVTVDGEPASTQWSDVTDTLATDDRLDLDVETGDQVVVEYLGGDEPASMLDETVPPTTDFEFDVGESSVEITHAGGEAVEADALEVRLFGVDSPFHRPDAFASEYDTVEEGDSIVVEYRTAGGSGNGGSGGGGSGGGGSGGGGSGSDDGEGDSSSTRPNVVMVHWNDTVIDNVRIETDEQEGTDQDDG